MNCISNWTILLHSLPFVTQKMKYAWQSLANEGRIDVVILFNAVSRTINHTHSNTINTKTDDKNPILV